MCTTRSTSSATPVRTVQRQTRTDLPPGTGRCLVGRGRVGATSITLAPQDVEGAVRERERPDHREAPRTAPSAGPARSPCRRARRACRSDRGTARRTTSNTSSPRNNDVVASSTKSFHEDSPPSSIESTAEMQVQVEDETEARDAVQREGPGCRVLGLEGRTSRSASRRYPCAARVRARHVPPGPGSRRSVVWLIGSPPPGLGSRGRSADERAPRSAMILAAGFTFEGHASVHSNAAWQRHAPSGSSAQSRRSARSAPRGSSSIRWAAASAAGPTYRSVVSPRWGTRTGTARIRCSPRTAIVRRDAVGAARLRVELALADVRDAVGEALVELLHVHDEVGEHRDVRDRARP